MEEQAEAVGRLYRSAKPLPFELLQHCGIFLEEKLYTQALSLLINILTSGTLASTSAFCPPTQYLAIAATLVVHPSTAQRAKTSEEREAASVALRLLRLVNNLIGPVSSNLNIAFSFTHFESSRHGTRRRTGDVDTVRESSGRDVRPLNLDVAGSGSIWSRAEDFWHVVGWAFNCSILHSTRWERWRIWLQYMCDVLEDDWNERLKLSQTFPARDVNGDAAGPVEPQDMRDQILRDSLIFRYISTDSRGYGWNRRIVRAIFADGSSTSVNEFHEVFRNELKEHKNEAENPKKREAEVNIDNDEYGDYVSQDNEEDSEIVDESWQNSARRTIHRQKRSRRSTRATADSNTEQTDIGGNLGTASTTYSQEGLSLLGGYDSLALRQRILRLLLTVSQQFPTEFIPVEDTYDLYVENLRRLPLPIFHSFVNPYVLPYFTPAARTSLCENILFRMLESAAPDSEEEYFTQRKLEECFLPFTAHTASVVDNAKVSITLEALLLLLADHDMLEVTPTFKAAMERGIAARASQLRSANRKHHNTNRQKDDLERAWLLESGDRLIFLVNEVLCRV